jgi:hypothetical protein
MHRSQLDTVIRRMNQILFRTEISLRRLDRSVPEEQLDLLELASCSPAQLRGGAATVVRRDPRTPAVAAYGRSTCQTTFSDRTLCCT